MKWQFERLDSYAGRVRRSSREIAIAAVLTVAAFAFLIAAFMGSAGVDGTKLGPVAAGQNTSEQR